MKMENNIPTYEIVIDESCGIESVVIVDEPPHGASFLAFSEDED